MDSITLDKVSFAIQALLMFLNISKESHVLTAGVIKKTERESLDLLEEVKLEKIEIEDASMRLNEIIKKMNTSLDQYVPYPPFMTDSPENHVRCNIIAFEHYLTQELKTHHLSFQQEAPLFNESLSLWEGIGGPISSEEGEYKLTSLIQKLNGLLPKEERYPVPGKKKR